jgi:hypothetical protein
MIVALTFVETAYAVALIALTAFEFLHDTPRLEYPGNPSFAFHPCQWVTGGLLPLAVAWFAMIMPETAFPVPPARENADDDRGAST